MSVRHSYKLSWGNLNYWQHPLSWRKRKGRCYVPLLLQRMYTRMYATEIDRESNIWIALGTESLNQLLPHHKNLYCFWLSHNTTNKAHRTADKPTMMDITQLTAVIQPPGLHALKLCRMCRLWLWNKYTCNKQVLQRFWLHFFIIFLSRLFCSYVATSTWFKGCVLAAFEPRLFSRLVTAFPKYFIYLVFCLELHFLNQSMNHLVSRVPE